MVKDSVRYREILHILKPIKCCAFNQINNFKVEINIQMRHITNNFFFFSKKQNKKLLRIRIEKQWKIEFEVYYISSNFIFLRDIYLVLAFMEISCP